ncbi:MAG: glycosyltransferase family 4 protein [Patescibacteria group bacterium]
MRKILVITFEFPPQVGGIATYLDQLCRHYDPKNIVVLAPKYPGDADFDRSLSYQVVRRQLLFPRFFWPRWIKLCLLAWRISRKEKIDLIMIHHILPTGYAALFVKKTLKIPFLVFSHGTDTQLILERVWKKKMMGAIINAAKKIIFNSESLKRKFLEKTLKFEDKSLVLYPCPEPDFFVAPAAETLEKMRAQYALAGKKVILSVGRLADGKGFPHIVRILPRILETNPNIVWILIGAGSKKAEITTQIQANSLQNVVRYIGEVPHSALKPYYYLVDLFLLLTHPDEGREEGLGQVFLEAQAAALPIVGGYSGGVEEAVANGQAGMLFDVRREEQAIIKTVLELLNNGEYARTMGARGRQRMKDEFNWNHQLAKIREWTD